VTSMLRTARHVALVTITAIVAAASVTSFAESYRGLFDWAREHGLNGVWAAAWPLQVDTFIAVGELALFVALADRWSVRSRVGAWVVTIAGLGVSVAGNVGHVAGHSLTNRGSAAVPPLAAAAALAVGLGVLKRVVQAHHDDAPGGQRDGATAATAPTAHENDRVAARHDAPALAPADAQPRVRSQGASRGASRNGARRASPADMEASALAVLARQPGIAGAELGRAIGASPRTGQRLLTRLNGRANGEHGTA
jgi:hypothetical protein